MRVHYFFVVFINFNFLLIFFFFNIKFTLSLSCLSAGGVRGLNDQGTQR